MVKKAILYIDNVPKERLSVQNALKHIYHIHMARSGEEGLQLLASESIQLVMTSYNLPGMTGPELIKQAKSKYPDLSFILQTDRADLEIANAEKTHIGRFRTIITPDAVEDYLLYIDQELEYHQHILDLKAKNSLLEDSQLHLSQIVDTTIDGVLTIDGAQRIVMTNPAIEKMFGYTKQEMTGLSLKNLIPEVLRHNHEKHIKKFGNSKVSSKMMGVSYDIKGVRSNGVEFPIETSISNTSLNGKIFFNAIVRDITQRVEYANSLKRSEEKFKTLSESSILPILVAGPGKRIAYINQAGLDLFEYTQKEILKMNFLQLVHQDSKVATENRYKKKISKTASPRKNVMKILSKSGKIYEIESYTSNIEFDQKPAVLVSIHDISDLKRAERNIKSLNEKLEERVKIRTKKLEAANKNILKREQELLKANEQLTTYKTLLENIPHVSWTGNSDGQVTYLSKAWETWTGRKIEKSLGVRWTESVHPDDLKPLLKKWENAYLHGKPYKGECRFMDQNNRVTYCSFIGIPIRDDDKKVKFWAGIDYNISELKETQRSLQKANKYLDSRVKERTKMIEVLNEELEERVKNRTIRLEKANREIKKVEKELRLVYENEKILGDLKSRFVSVASHQFRTPLTVIQSNTDILRLQIDQLDPEDDIKTNFKKATNRILEEISRMKNIMDDVLILGKINAKRITSAREQTDVLALCENIALRFNNIEDNRVVHLESTGSPTDILIDADLIDQAISNLLANAFKYSDGDILIKTSYKKKMVHIEIIDSGIGIPSEDIKNLFDPFYRANNVSKTPGTGLGLSITKEYVELNHGTIAVSSELGKKTTFCIVLPFYVKEV